MLRPISPAIRTSSSFCTAAPHARQLHRSLCRSRARRCVGQAGSSLLPKLRRVHTADAEIKLIFEKYDLRKDSRRVPKLLIDRIGHDDTRYVLVGRQVSLHPAHVPRKLAERSIRATFHFEFEHKEVAIFIDCEDIDEADISSVLDSRSSILISEQTKPYAVNRQLAQISRNEVTQVSLQREQCRLIGSAALFARIFVHFCAVQSFPIQSGIAQQTSPELVTGRRSASRPVICRELLNDSGMFK